MTRVRRKRQLAILEWLALLGVGLLYTMKTLNGDDEGLIAGPIYGVIEGSAPVPLASFLAGVVAILFVVALLKPAWQALEFRRPVLAMPFVAVAFAIAAFVWIVDVAILILILPGGLGYIDAAELSLATALVVFVVAIARVAIPDDVRLGIATRARDRLGRVRT